MITVLTLVCLYLLGGQASGKKFAHSQHLHHDYLLEWNYDNESITMRLTAETTSWIGLGLSPKYEMAGADIIMGGVKHDKGYILDAHALKAGPPIVDESQDVTLLDSSQIDGITSLTIKRKLKIDDQFNRDIKVGEMGVIWAYGFMDINEEPEYYDYHWWRRGEAQVNFITNLNEAEKDFEYSVKLYDDEDDEDDVTLAWYHSEDEITFKYTAPTSGWIGFGFSPGGSMAGADIIIGGVRRDKRYLFDSYATKNGSPKVDNLQDVELVKLNQDNYFTTMIVRRKLKTSDAKDMDITHGKMNIIWAYGTYDIYSHPGKFSYHLWNRGTKKVELLRNKMIPTYIPEPGMPEEETSSFTPETTSESEPTPRTREPSIVIDQARGTVALDSEGEVQFFWSQDSENIIIAISAPTAGWIGVGFSSGPTMAGADLVIAGLGDDNEGYILDAHATENGTPVADVSQDVTLLMASQNNTSTRVMFERKMTAQDSYDFAITSGEIYVLWAYGTDDPVGNPTVDNYHGTNRGAKKMVLRPTSMDWP
ncbi:uncharacterized protein LOC120338410 isoform X1 [Styela clava]